MEQSGARCQEDDGMCHGRLILLPHRLFNLSCFLLASVFVLCAACRLFTLMEQSGARCEEDDGMCHGRLISLPHRLTNLSCFFVGFCFCVLCCLQVAICMCM